MPSRFQAFASAAQPLLPARAAPRSIGATRQFRAASFHAASSSCSARYSPPVPPRTDRRQAQATLQQSRRHVQTASTSTSSSTPPPPSPGRTTSTRPCPLCQTPLSPSVSPCPSCSTLIPLPPGLSHHSLLGLCDPIPSPSPLAPYDIAAELAALPARGFDLKPRDLRNRMLARQRDLHPDKYGSGGEGVVGLARDLSGRVNMAYETLADPLKRAEYILSIYKLPVEETDSLTDPMLLGEIMEAREELEEAQSEEEVDRVRAANQEKIEATISSLSSAFSADPPDLREAKNLAVQLKYWMSLEMAAKEWTPGNGVWPERSC